MRNPLTNKLRSVDVDFQWVIGDHYFAKASSECLEVYRDGHFIATTMMTHAINEAIIEFIVERNPQIKRKDEKGDSKSVKTLIRELQKEKIISDTCAKSSQEICGSFRNDIHHLNPPVEKINFFDLARQNLQRLAQIEGEIFGVDVVADGKLRLHNLKYWDLNPDGTIRTFLRLE